MGKPLPASAIPSGSFAAPSGDLANTVQTGSLTAKGPGSPFMAYGAFNVLMWPSYASTLTTSAAGATGTVASATGLIAGMTINCASLPPGTTIATLSGTTITFGFAPEYAAANVAAGTSIAAVFMGDSGANATATFTASLERTFDGGQTWLTCGIGGAGSPAEYAFASSGLTGPVSFVAAEPEKGVSYRVNCTAYSAGTLNYRFSTNGLAAMAWGIPIG